MPDDAANLKTAKVKLPLLVEVAVSFAYVMRVILEPAVPPPIHP
jgi:hypothetical protein